MRFSKCGITALAVGVAVAVCMASIGVATAATVASNVALFQPVTIESGTWVGHNGTTDPFNPTTVTDDMNGYLNSATTTLSGLWVDLGQPYTVESLWFGYKGKSYVNGVKLRGYAADQVTEIGTAITVPGTGVYAWTRSDWIDVQWIKIADEGASPAIMKEIRELRAFAQVETYAGFVPGVTATATNSYVGHGDLYPTAACNSAGMDDQRGPVGNPGAKSLVNGSWWSTDSTTTNATITFDLGGKYDLDEMRIWNNCQISHVDRGIQHALIEYSSDGGTTYTALADANGDLDDGNYTIPIADDLGPNPYSLAIDLTSITANFVRITGLDSHGGDQIGLAEVRFYGDKVAMIPGDTNGDDVVDAADAATLASNWLRQVTNGAEGGDFNLDTWVNDLDASILAAHWAYSAGGTSAVPEPWTGTLLLSLLVSAGALRARRRTRS